jgi:hypothetical protein
MRENDAERAADSWKKESLGHSKEPIAARDKPEIETENVDRRAILQEKEYGIL